MTIISTPELVILSGNPVLFTIQQSTIQVAHFVHIEILNEFSEVVGTDVRPATADNSEITFNVSDYLKEEVSEMFTFDKLNTAGLQISKLSRKFNFVIFETWNNETSRHNETLLPDDYIVMQGFLSRNYEKYYRKNIKYNEYYSTLLQADKRFITHQLKERISTIYRNDILYFLSLIDDVVNMKFRLFFDDNSSIEIFKNAYLVDSNTYYFFSSGFITNDLQAYEIGKKITKYEVYIVDTNNNLQTEIITYDINRTYYNNRTNFVFKNTLGTFDTIELLGVEEYENEFEKIISYTKGREIITNSKKSNSISVNSGWLSNLFKDTKLASLYFIELFNSTEIFEIIDENLVPILIQSNKLSSYQSNIFNYSFKIEYSHQIIDANYYQIEEDGGIEPPAPSLIYLGGTNILSSSTNTAIIS